MNNSDEFFLKQMKGVSPIKKKNRIKKESTNLNYKPLGLQQSKKKTNQSKKYQISQSQQQD